MPEVTTPLRRRGEQQGVAHPELLEPIVLPTLHYAMIPMPEYEAFREWGAQVDRVQEAIERGRLEGKLDGYQKVLEHVRTSSVLSPKIDNRTLLESILLRLIGGLQDDLNRMGPEPEQPQEGVGNPEQPVPGGL